jgi:hypothetical protein
MGKSEGGVGGHDPDYIKKKKKVCPFSMKNF